MKFIIFLLLPFFGHSQWRANSTSPTRSQLPTLKYEWRKVSGPSQFRIESPDSAVTKITNLEAGIYQFELKVTNSNGLSGRDTMVLTVHSLINKAYTKAISKITKAPYFFPAVSSLRFHNHVSQHNLVGGVDRALLPVVQ